MKSKLLTAVITTTVLGSGLYLLNSSSDKNASYAPRKEKAEQQAQKWNGGALEYYMKVKANQVTGKIDYKDVLKAREQVTALKAKRSGAANLAWVEMGPTDEGGRTRAILVDKTKADGSRVYAGSVSGGLYVSNNGAATWQPVDDLAENLIVSCIDQASDGTIYFGTGSSFDGPSGFGGSGFLGRGLFKLQPGSSTITKIPSASPPDGNNSAGAEWVEINSVKVDQTTGRIYVAQKQGLRYSDDGGATWVNPVYLVFPNIQNTGEGQDIEIADDGTILVSINGTIFRSPNGNDGDTYVNVSSSPLPSSSQRLELAIAPSNNNFVYAFVVSSSTLQGIYRSTDKGLTWVLLQEAITDYFQPCISANGQCYYDCCLAVNPKDENTIYIGGVQLWRWNGNLTRVATEFGGDFSGTYVHSDKHTFAFDEVNDIMYIGSDGGVSVGYGYDNTFITANSGYVTTQFYGIGFDSDGKVMGGTQDNGTIEVDPNDDTDPTGGNDVMGGDGFDCDYSMLTDAKFSTIYPGVPGHVSRASGEGAPSGICEAWNCNEATFFTVIRMWETMNQPNSEDSVLFTAEDTATMDPFAVGTGNGSVKTFSGIITPPQKAANFVVGSIQFVVGSKVLVDPDGDGNLTGDGSGTFSYTTGDFNITFSTAPVLSSIVKSYYSATYNAGDTLFLSSKTGSGSILLTHVLTQTLNPGNKVMVQDPVQSMLAFGGSGNVYVTRRALDFSVNPIWMKISGIGGSVKSLEFSKDGNHLFVGNYSGNVYRISGLNSLYISDGTPVTTGNPPDTTYYDVSASSDINITLIFSGGGARVVTGIGVDPDNAENVVVTLGNYGNTDYVYRSTSAISTTNNSSFTSIQGDLPEMPVYDAIISIDVDKTIVVGTEYGVYSTTWNNAGSWSDENNTFSHTPVFAVRQAGTWFGGMTNLGAIYLGTHGRGLWRSDKYTGIGDIEHPDFSNDVFVSDLSVYPNPMTSEGYLLFNMQEAANGFIEVYDLSGKLVKSESRPFDKGENRIQFNNAELAHGTYFAMIRANNKRAVAKFIVMK